MPRIDTLTGVSAGDVPNLKKEYEDDGATVVVTADGNSTFTIVATYPDQAPTTGSSGDASGSKPGAASGTGGGAPISLSDRVPIPPQDKMNPGLTSCTEGTMLTKFGKPGALTTDCSQPTGAFQQRVRPGFNVGPFKVTGLDYAVESLLQIFSDVRKENQTLFEQVKNDGMLCVRARRHNPGHYSNHSWGTAIDIYFGDAVVDQGVKLTHRGNFLLAPYFNRHGWYWGAEFSGDSVDSMHFELAEETIHKIPDQVMFDSVVSVDSISYQPGPEASKILGDIVGLIKKAKIIDSQFVSRVDFLGKLPSGELIFDSELQLDTDGWPDGKGKGDSSWQADTSWHYANSGAINANEVPYFVLPLPKSWPTQFGINLGDLAAVVFKDKLAFATFADQGPVDKLGEGSIELLRRLGEERIRPNGRVINSGMGPGVVTIVFPGSGLSSPPPDQKTLLDYIESRGKIKFLKLGGNLPSEVANG